MRVVPLAVAEEPEFLEYDARDGDGWADDYILEYRPLFNQSIGLDVNVTENGMEGRTFTVYMKYPWE